VVEGFRPGRCPEWSFLGLIGSVGAAVFVELTYWERMTPRHPALGRRMIFGANVGNTRAGSHGATYQCPGVFVMGEDMEFQVLRPSVIFPDDEAIFRAALDFAGLECKVSDKGAYGITPTMDLEPSASCFTRSSRPGRKQFSRLDIRTFQFCGEFGCV
jgi:hypothetical protein